MLWVKAFHIVFVMAWFAGLFYLPRIFVNLAEDAGGPATDRLLKMARRLYRFTWMLAGTAIVLGLILFLYYGIGLGPGNGWMHAKLGMVLLILGYQHGCGALLKKFERGENRRSHVWYRYFNEVPVLMLVAVACLVVVKPF
jgi:putative membrane protein